MKLNTDDNTDAFWSTCNVTESDSCFHVLQEQKCQLTTELCDWSDPTVTNKLLQHMASSAGHVPKVPQAFSDPGGCEEQT